MTLQPFPELRLDRLGELEAEALMRAASGEPRERARGARALAAVAAPEVVIQELTRLALDRDVGVRMAAVSALAALPWRGRLDLLARALDDADLGVALVAAQGLTHARDRRAAPVLRELVGQRKLRFEALEALFELNDPDARPLAERTFGALFASPFERGAAALTLARAGDEKARAHLVTRLSNRRAEERPMLLVHALMASPEATLPVVQRIAESTDDYLKESALLALVRIDVAYWPRLHEALSGHVDTEPATAAELLLSLHEIDPVRTGLIARAHRHREDPLGEAAHAVEVANHLRDRHPDEVLLRCA